MFEKFVMFKDQFDEALFYDAQLFTSAKPGHQIVDCGDYYKMMTDEEAKKWYETHPVEEPTPIEEEQPVEEIISDNLISNQEALLHDENEEIMQELEKTISEPIQEAAKAINEMVEEEVAKKTTKKRKSKKTSE